MLLVLMICGFVFSILALGFSVVAYIETQSFKKSTHSVQYVGAKPSDIGVSETPEGPSPLDILNKEYSEEVGNVMPWASSSEEDIALRSF